MIGLLLPLHRDVACSGRGAVCCLLSCCADSRLWARRGPWEREKSLCGTPGGGRNCGSVAGRGCRFHGSRTRAHTVTSTPSHCHTRAMASDVYISGEGPPVAGPFSSPTATHQGYGRIRQL